MEVIITDVKKPESDKICENCSKWYKNNHGGERCIWNNKDVPKRDDYCSRFEENI